jgi:hypothetical protein
MAEIEDALGRGDRTQIIPLWASLCPNASIAFGIGSVGGGRVPRKGSGVYNLAKNGDGAFRESLRQEVTKRHVCVSLAAISPCDRPAYQWIKISEMSIRSKVLRAIGSRSSIPKNARHAHEQLRDRGGELRDRYRLSPWEFCDCPNWYPIPAGSTSQPKTWAVSSRSVRHTCGEVVCRLITTSNGVPTGVNEPGDRNDLGGRRADYTAVEGGTASTARGSGRCWWWRRSAG